MLRLPRQQALKALRSPLHNTLHYPVRGPVRDPLRSSLLKHFRNPLLIRHAHTKPVPLSGPPSYATINRRFSSEPNPIDFFAENKAKEAIERGEFVDIHNIGGVGPKDYDVLNYDVLTTDMNLQKATKDEANKKIEFATDNYDLISDMSDMSDNKLRTEIAELLGIPYLQKATKEIGRAHV